MRLCEDYHGEPWLTLGPDRNLIDKYRMFLYAVHVGCQWSISSIVVDFE